MQKGHGDLRPEHVWLGDPLQIIDCLEFNRSMRMLDPYDEVNYLGMECEILGAAWIREHLMAGVTRHCGHPPSDNLLAAYGAFRALLRARISIVHLLEKPIRKPEKWRPLTLRYLNQARCELVKSQGRAGRRSNRLREAG
jgi:aminoglycoside phosphotransferase family enzyme